MSERGCSHLDAGRIFCPFRYGFDTSESLQIFRAGLSSISL